MGMGGKWQRHGYNMLLSGCGLAFSFGNHVGITQGRYTRMGKHSEQL